MIEFELPQKNENIIKVVGVGGGGGNAVNHMYSLGIDEVDFIVCNTDMKALSESAVPIKVQLGPELTQGLGAGAKPDVGREATTESLDEIKKAFGDNTQMVFVTAGMGGGTGTGGAPIVAKLAKESGALTVGIVTTPFSYEGKKRKQYAQDGIDELKKNVDTLLIISNDKVRQHFGNVAISEAFCKADDILATAAKCITDVISSKGHIIVDFADVCTVMREGGRAILGNAKAGGENRAAIAVEEALSSPLLNDNSIQGAKWILLNVNSSQGDTEHTLDEMELIQAYVQEKAGDDCDLILGMGYDEDLGDNIGITIIATGFKENETEEAFRKSNLFEKDKVFVSLEEEAKKVEHTPKNISDKVPQLGKADIDYTPTTFQVEPLNATPITALGLRPEDEVIPAFEESFMEDEVPAVTSLGAFIEESVPEMEELAGDEGAECEIISFEKTEEIRKDLMQTYEMENNIDADETVAEEEAVISFEMNIEGEIEEQMTAEPTVEKPVVEEPTVEAPVFTTTEMETPSENNWEDTEVGETIELFVKDDVSEVEEVTFDTPQFEAPVVAASNEMKAVEKNEDEVTDEYVTIKGITLARKKGSRMLTDYELEQEANFELQKRAFDERASKLRSMSYDVNKLEGQQEDEEIPAYVRRNQALDNHAHSSDEEISGTSITEDKNSLNSNVSTLNNFLNGNNPD